MRRRAWFVLTSFVLLAAAFVAIAVTGAVGTTRIRISPVGVVDTPTPTIQAYFTGAVSAGWSTTTTTPPTDISISVDGRLLTSTTESATGSMVDLIASAPVLEPLSEGLHSVVASSSTGTDYWTFEYRADSDTIPPAITDVWPLGQVDDYHWARNVRFAVEAGAVDIGSSVATVTVDAVEYATTYSAPYFRSVDLPLSLGSHEVTVSVTDATGKSATRSWTYDLTSLPSVPTITFAPNATGIYSVFGMYTAPYLSVAFGDIDGIVAGSERVDVTSPDGTTYEDLPTSIAWSTYYGGTGDTNGTLQFTVNPTLPEGPRTGSYTATISLTDKYGMTGTGTADFRLSYESPTVARVAPSATVHTRPSEVTAVLADAHSGISRATGDVEFFLDGQELPVTFERADGATDDTTLTAHAAIPESISLPLFTDHVLSYSIADKAGIKTNGTWSFYYTEGVTVQELVPTPDSSVATDTPLVQATLHDPDGFPTTGFSLYLDGHYVPAAVALSADAHEVTISHRTRLLSGVHTVRVTGASSRGSAIDRTWTFDIDSFTDMSLTDANAACEGCHRYPTNSDRTITTPAYSYVEFPSSRLFDDIHNVNLGQKDHDDMRCLVCHDGGGVAVASEMTQMPLSPQGFFRVTCNLCHLSDGTSLAGWWPAPDYRRPIDGTHSATSTTSYLYIRPGSTGADGWVTDPTYFRRVQAPRRGIDCEYCHQVPRSFSGSVGPHEVSADHTVEFGGDGCGDCHDAVLTREHAKANVRDSRGDPLACASCHDPGRLPSAPSAQIMRAYYRGRSGLELGKAITPGWYRWQSQEFSADEGLITGFHVTLKEFDFSRPTVIVEVRRPGESAWVPVVRQTTAPYGIGDTYYREVWRVLPTTSGVQKEDRMRIDVDTDVVLAQPAEAVRFAIEVAAMPVAFARADLVIDEIRTDAGPTKCSTCHGEGPWHEAEHATRLDDRCAGCHGAVSSTDHVNRGMSCNTCHATLTSTVAFSRRTCGDCHSIGHQQSFATSLSSEIFYDPQFDWTRPLPAGLFAGESWMPAEAVAGDGSVAVAARAQTSVAEAWNAFRQAMVARGWTSPSGRPDAGAASFSATLSKGQMRCEVVLWSGETHAASAAGARGTRAEVVWWVVPQ